MKIPTTRIVFTVIILLGMFAFDYVYTTFEGPMEGSMAVATLEDDAMTYGMARRGIQKAIPEIFFCTAFGILLLIWGTFGLKVYRHYHCQPEKQPQYRPPFEQ